MPINKYSEDLLYSIPPEDHDPSRILALLESHKNIRFAAFIGVELTGESVTETIPIEEFIVLAKLFYESGTRDDEDVHISIHPGFGGPKRGIISMRPDLDVVWMVDYSLRSEAPDSCKPCGTLMIPSFLIENQKRNCARSILQKAVKTFSQETYQILKSSQTLCSGISFSQNQLTAVEISVTMELSFWVFTTKDTDVLPWDVDCRSTGKDVGFPLHPQFHAAAEESLFLLEKYGFKPKIIQERCETKILMPEDRSSRPITADLLKIKWSYENALYAADCEFFVRYCLEKSFQNNGLSISFSSRSIEELSINNEYYYINISAVLNNGEKKNLLTSSNRKDPILGSLGWSMIYGILRHYCIITPFLSPKNNSFQRYSVTSQIMTSGWFGNRPREKQSAIPLSFIKPPLSPEKTRLTFQFPHPFSNSYLSLAAISLCLLDGVRYAASENRDIENLERKLLPAFVPDTNNWEANCRYLFEEDTFISQLNEGKSNRPLETPKTVYESLRNFLYNDNMIPLLCSDNVFTEANIAAFTQTMLALWQNELTTEILPAALLFVRSIVMTHRLEDSYDEGIWEEIQILRRRLAKDTKDHVSIFTEIRLAIDSRNLKELSRLQLVMEQYMNELRSRYMEYSQNQV